MKHNIHTLRSLLKNRRYRKVVFNLFKLLLIIVLVVFFIFTAISYKIYTSARKIESERDIERNFMRSANAFNIILQTIDRDYTTINFDEDIQQLITKDRTEVDNLPSTAIINNSVQTLTLITLGNRLYDSLHLYCPRSDTIVSWSEFARRDEFYDTSWIPVYEQNGAEYSWFGISHHDNTPAISVFKEIKANNAVTAFMIFNLEYSYVADLLAPEGKGRPIFTALITSNGNIVFCTDSAFLNKNINDYDELSWFYGMEQPQIEGIISLHRDDSFYLSYPSADANYLLMSMVDINEYSGARGSLFNILIIGSLIGFMLSLLLALLMSIRIYTYLFDIVVILQSPNRFDISNTASPSDEMNLISTNILSRTNPGKSIEVEFAKQLSELRKAQSMALQAQINPHFLLNTMQVVYLSIIKEVKKECKASNIILLLSSILRSNLQTRDYLIRFSDEAAVARKYLEIETIRNGAFFSVQWDIDDKVHDLYVVRFILQPILENSIMYGFKGNKNPGKLIRISAREESKQLVIRIEDNGSGMDQEALASLQERLARQDIPEDEHIGLCNVNMRLKLIFGADSGVTVESTRGEGTAVTLKMPAVADI